VGAAPRHRGWIDLLGGPIERLFAVVAIPSYRNGLKQQEGFVLTNRMAILPSTPVKPTHEGNDSLPQRCTVPSAKIVGEIAGIPARCFSESVKDSMPSPIPVHPRSSTHVGLSDSQVYPMYFAPQR
jgi:hypothetical protein